MSEYCLGGVRCIAFDFCGTLAELRPTSEEVLSAWINRETGSISDVAGISTALQRVSVEMPYSSLELRTEQDRRQYFIRFNAKVLALIGQVECDGEDLYIHFCRQQRHWVLRSGAADVLRELSTRGFQIVLASNFDPTLEQLLTSDGLTELFSALFVSGSIGLEKPDFAFYKHMQVALGLPAPTIAMVGDDLNLDVHPAIAMGMKAIHFMPNREVMSGIPNTSNSNHLEISKLEDLLHAFGQTMNSERSAGVM